MLTARQRDLLVFIEDTQLKTGDTPTYPKMMAALGLKSKNGINRMLNALIERGFIWRQAFDPGRGHSPAIVILRSATGGKTPPDPTRIPIYDADTLQLRGYLP